jgi:hypothetical protein
MGDSLTSTASFTEILSSFASISAEFLLLSRVFLIAILSERNVAVIDWPPNSPDQNPQEEV